MKRARTLLIVAAVVAGGGIIFAASGDDTGRTNAFGDNPTASTVELIENGGFERAANPASDWVLSGSLRIQDPVDSLARGKQVLTSLAAYTRGYAYQDVDIPSNATTAELSFWVAASVYTATTEPGFLSVEVDPYQQQPGQDGSFGPEVTSSSSKILAKFGPDRCSCYAGAITFGTFKQHVRYSLAQYRGKSVRIYFAVLLPDGQTNRPPAFFVDDVSLKVSSTTTPDLLVATAATTPASDVTLLAYPRYSGALNNTYLTRASGLGFSTKTSVNPASQTFTLANNVINAPLNYTITDDMAWLTTSVSSGSFPTQGSKPVTATANVAGLAAGEYSGAITITAPGASGAPYTIPVTLSVVDPNPPTPRASASLSSIVFTGARAGANPAPKSFTLTATAGLPWAAASNRPWLKVSPASGSGTSTITVTVTTAGLGLGSHQGTVTITVPGIKPVTVTVRADITTSGQPAPTTY